MNFHRENHIERIFILKIISNEYYSENYIELIFIMKFISNEFS